MDAIECIGCKPWQSVFPTRAMYLERYYYDLKHLADYLTPMRLYDLCRADEEGNRSYKCMYIGLYDRPTQYSPNIFQFSAPALTTLTYARYTLPVFTSLVYGPGRVHGPAREDTREYGPSRLAGAIVNDVIIISYLHDGCPK